MSPYEVLQREEVKLEFEKFPTQSTLNCWQLKLRFLTFPPMRCRGFEKLRKLRILTTQDAKVATGFVEDLDPHEFQEKGLLGSAVSQNTTDFFDDRLMATEADILSLDAGLRLEGILALMCWSLSLWRREVPCATSNPN